MPNMKLNHRKTQTKETWKDKNRTVATETSYQEDLKAENKLLFS